MTTQAFGTARPASPERLALVIPTLDAGPYLDRMIPALQAQTLFPSRFLVVDSGSRDGTVERFRAAGARVHAIGPEEFDHGATRQMAVEMLPGADIIIFLTQDAIPAHGEALARLVAAFSDARAGLAYGRQLPAPGATPIAAHARLFNYPDTGFVRSMADAQRYGIKTVFCSNSFAAYRRKALLEAGGFPEHTILSEDMLAAIAMLRKGWTLHYVADARTYHSHNYTVAQEFRRYFDIGVLHSTSPRLLGPFLHTRSEGLRFVRSELGYLLRRAPHLIPLALARTVSKYCGYRLGWLARFLPNEINQWFSLNRQYWTKRGAT
ncbi:MAG: glycosyltransferase family 2 protein [Gammaproteobacteria bacterium]|nr:glycosyltransferase family 2 protein [Gammaproteobacteria bacterium]NIR82791.1 glycosyltransferase family 2 protein [Gammaproteobacteria bacterium]NIR89900.1 glycosyltransferase family 2 protein [Gammaproteobacteria bacterium]NIX05877.1 glycosyltransferase [Gammaproteobacteria bacterium]